MLFNPKSFIISSCFSFISKIYKYVLLKLYPLRTVILALTLYICFYSENNFLAKLAFSVVILMVLSITPIFFKMDDNSEIVSALSKLILDISVLIKLVNDIYNKLENI